MSNNATIRVRIAPSPTGSLHVGTARSALYNYLFAKQNGGTFVLRIEDTDLERSDEKYTRDIMEGLLWLGIEWDEGPTLDGREKGKHGPYKQSARTEIYQKYLKKLIADGKVYPCYCTPEELEQERAAAAKKGESPKYSGKCRNLTEAEQKKLAAEGRNSILRFKTPAQVITFPDEIRGKVVFETDLIGDFSIARDQQTPLYNLAVVIDDYTMKISHVIRGEDHLSNTPKQILLQEALGFPRPIYAHLPLILNEDRSKLSKRMNNVSVIDYRRMGYLPQALLNFFVLLGWNPKTEEEIFTKEQLIKKFDLKNIHKGGAVFSQKRLDWMNGQYIRKISLDEFYNLALPFLKNYELNLKDEEYIKKAIALEKERIKNLNELPGAVSLFFQNELLYDPYLLIWKKTAKAEIKRNLETAGTFFQELPEKEFTAEKIEQKMKGLIATQKLNTGAILWPLRVALTGRESSPGPFEVAAVLRKEKVLKRINEALERLADDLPKKG